MRNLLILCVLCSCVAAGGCKAFQKSDNTLPADVTFTSGRLRGQVEAPLAKMVPAARAAMEEMKLHIVAFSSDAATGKVVAVTSDNVRIDIELHAKSPTATYISIGSSAGDATNDQAMIDLYNRIRSKAS
jgi:Protein of unknown function (DUF3568)